MSKKQFVPIYDLSAMTEEQKIDYIKSVCEHLEVPTELNLVRLIWSDEGDGARRQVAYALKGATDIIREKRKISTESLTSIIANGSIIFTATGKDSTGRQEIAVGSSHIEGLKGRALDNGIMTAQTRSTRRMTLQFVGGGVLDESEVNTTTTNIATQSTPLSQLSLAPQPTVKPNDAAGKDVTPVTVADVYRSPEAQAAVQKVLGKDVTPLSVEAMQKGAEAVQKAFNTAHDLIVAQHPEAGKAVEIAKNLSAAVNETPLLKATAIPGLGPLVSDLKAENVLTEDQAAFRDRMDKMRADAIAQLNAKAESTEPKKRRGRKSKTVDLSSPEQADIKADTAPASTAITPAPAVVPEQLKADIKADQVAVLAPPTAPEASTVQPAAVPSPLKPRLTQEQVKPFRQRLFRLVNDYLEPNGFTPKEGMGNADKMRNLAGIMFPSVQNMNELTVEQWEKYLGSLETRVQKDGAASTVKYIEDAIGI